MKVVTKKELIARVSSHTGTARTTTENVIDQLLDEIKWALAEGDKVQIKDFGGFEVKERAAREGRNPQTGEKITIKASKNVGFKAGKTLKDALN